MAFLLRSLPARRLVPFVRHQSTLTMETPPPVNCHNEWDPLEEIIVGRVEGAHLPGLDVHSYATFCNHWRPPFGQPYPGSLIEKAADELNGLARTLEARGITVRRPEVHRGDFGYQVQTPDWTCRSARSAAMPRDGFLVLGNEIIEAPMCNRSRYFEWRSFRSLFLDYFKRGATLTSAPQPRLTDDLYLDTWADTSPSFVPSLAESEIVFDAAEFGRFGEDIFVQATSHTINRLGIEWMRRHLEARGYRLHELRFADKKATHIDATFVPLAEGRLLVHPERPCLTGEVVRRYRYQGRSYEYRLPKILRDWELLLPDSPPDLHKTDPNLPLYFSSAWTAITNPLVIKPGTVVAPAHEPRILEQFDKWGIECVPVDYKHVLPFGGSIHCSTLDIRRRGERRSHVNNLE